MELNISELRKQGRPLWMTGLDVESHADLIGGGGDIYSDRLAVDWGVDAGLEVEEDEQLITLLEGRYVNEDYVS
ncbi:MAG: hypothetical protein HPY84_06655 [Syntrophobacteraceae bacterium]|nr:hypothetical protein [Syntrophobacteraceae bacterium]